MMAQQIIEIIKEEPNFITPKWFSEKFGVGEQNAQEILEVGVMNGILYHTKITELYGVGSESGEYGIKEIITTESIEKFQEFLSKFYQDMKRKNFMQLFTIEVQAQKFMELQPFFYDKMGCFWLWNHENFCWEITDDIDMLNMIREGVESGLRTQINNSKLRTEILNALKQTGRLNIPEEIKPSWIQFKEKIIDIETGEEFEAKPHYFVANPISWKLGKNEETPTIDKLFFEWVGEEHKEELYEIIAFSIVPDYFIHRIICLIGSGANGKTTYLQLISKFIGKRNITGVSLDALMNSRFSGAKLLKKLVCLMGETNFNTLQKTDFLKKLSGGDEVPGEMKNKNPFDFVNYAKLIMASNSLPMTADKTDGFYRRWKIIDFSNKFDKEQDVLSQIPEKEFENLALKCLNIVKRLWTNRIFTNDGDFDERRRRYEEKSNPVMLYIKENYVKDINSEILFSEFYDGLKDFLNDNGFRALSPSAVSKQLKMEGFDISKTTIKDKKGNFIIGISKNNSRNSRNSLIPHLDTHVDTNRKLGSLGSLGSISNDSSLNDDKIEVKKI